ncbi:MAG: hypothetical protein HDR71_04125 [Lachnospiraceae bacterium]|nr:hypothetical protein [Lachnospiraceae bacterium]
MKEPEYIDSVILALRTKCEEKQEEQQQISDTIHIGVNKISIYREELFGGKCSIMLPEIMSDMNDTYRMIKYRNQNRPQIIKTDVNGDATVTFSLLSMTDIENAPDISAQMEKLHQDMQKVWKQHVFYDTGQVEAGELPVAWMDFRSFCMDGSLYNLLFIFQIKEQIVLGNFHCSFPQYDIWKPAVLKLLTTVQVNNPVDMEKMD